MTTISNASLVRLESYWQEHEDLLKSCYAGVNKSYFIDIFKESGLSLEDFLSQIKNKRPLDYIAKKRNFVGYDFFVDERVLIPRFETELLYELALKEMKNKVINDERNFQLAEVGVGSGCLGLSLLMDSSRRIDFWAGDISSDALDVFCVNLKKYHKVIQPNHNITVNLSDRLTEATHLSFDLIISNPPYIKKKLDADKVHHTTLSHEPGLALFIEDEAYDQWFSDLFSQVYGCLEPDGVFIMEGHEDHLQHLLDIERVSDRIWSDLFISKDLTRRDRFLTLRKRSL